MSCYRHSGVRQWCRPEIRVACRRGIDVVRNKIKMFAHSKVTLPPGRHKIVILDEADRCSTPHPENPTPCQ